MNYAEHNWYPFKLCSCQIVAQKVLTVKLQSDQCNLLKCQYLAFKSKVKFRKLKMQTNCVMQILSIVDWKLACILLEETADVHSLSEHRLSVVVAYRWHWWRVQCIQGLLTHAAENPWAGAKICALMARTYLCAQAMKAENSRFCAKKSWVHDDITSRRHLRNFLQNYSHKFVRISY